MTKGGDGLQIVGDRLKLTFKQMTRNLREINKLCLLYKEVLLIKQKWYMIWLAHTAPNDR
jgi:hypothetical protein